MKRFVNDTESGKINNKKNATDSYLKYIYPDKKLLDTRNFVEKTVIRKGKDKGK